MERILVDAIDVAGNPLLCGIASEVATSFRKPGTRAQRTTDRGLRNPMR